MSRSCAWCMYTVPSGMRWETMARATTTPLRLTASIQSLSATPILSASFWLIQMPGPPRDRLSISRLSWYSEWMDHLLCGVRYRTAMPSSPLVPICGSPNRAAMFSGGRNTGRFSPSSVIQSWSRKKCCRPVRVCHGLSRSTLMVNGEYRRPPDSEPDHSGDVMTGVGAAWVSANVTCLPSCSAARSASWPAGALLQGVEALRWPGARWWCRTARGSPRTRARRAAGTAARRPAPPRTSPFLLAQVVDRPGQVERDALGRRAQRRGQRAERAELVGDRRVVALDDHQLRHRHARHRVALARLPVAHDARRGRHLVRGVVRERDRDDVLPDPEVRRRQRAERPGDLVERVEVGAGLPRRCDRRVERVHERVHVGAAQVVLLVPGGGRQHDVARTPWSTSSGSPASAAGRACRAGASSRQTTSRGRMLGRRLLRAQRGVGAQQVLEEVLVALARSCPAGSSARWSARAGSSPGRRGPRRRTAATPSCRAAGTYSRDRDARRRDVVGQRQAGCGRTWGSDGIQPSRADCASTSAVVMPGPRARPTSRPRARRRRTGRTGTGRCAGTSTRSGSCAAAGATSRARWRTGRTR